MTARPLRGAQAAWARQLRGALAALAVCWLLAAPGVARAAVPTPPPEDAIAAAVAAERFGGAVFLCDQAAREGAALTPRGREQCAAANLGLGDKLARVNSRDEARARWEAAAKLDPRLLDDPAYLARLTTGRAPGQAAAAAASPPTAPPRPPPAKGPRPAGGAEPPPGAPPALPAATAPGPRHGRTFGFGLGAGFDGILAATVGWLHAERLAIELSVGILYPTVDTRIRFYGLDAPLTPVIGLGMTTAFGRQPRFGLEVQTYEDLYKLGQTVHVDLGLSLAVWRLEIFAGVALLTTLDQQHPDRLLFFPQAGGQVLVYF